MKPELLARKFSLGELVSTTIKLFKENIVDVLKITAIVYIPYYLLVDFAIYFGDGKHLNSVSSIVNLIVIMWYSVLVYDRLHGGKSTIEELFKTKVSSKLMSGFVTYLLAGLIGFGLLLLLIVPGVIFLVQAAFVGIIAILTDKKNMDAINYSKQLVKGRWFETFGYLLLITLFSGAVAWAIGAVIFMFSDSYVTAVLYDVITEIPLAIGSIFLVVVYLNYTATVKSEPAAQVAAPAKEVEAEKVN
ncbi:MAG: hypothetical protein Fur003_6450 [Candidatus Dojkabacteria bacterium]